eukprot:COSAG06_NODE_18373_length_890_cov_5.055626_2_plen_149_part_01
MRLNATRWVATEAMQVLGMPRSAALLCAAAMPIIAALVTDTARMHVAPQVCLNGTVCAAAYSGNGHGCCPYDDAVCCPNSQTCCPKGSRCDDTGTYWSSCIGETGPQKTGLAVCKPVCRAFGGTWLGIAKGGAVPRHTCAFWTLETRHT